MIEFTATASDLKQALSIVALATEENVESIHGHALFSTTEEGVTLYSTDEDRMATAYLPVEGLDSGASTRFTLDPKKLQALIGTSKGDTIRFAYEDETKTLNVYASEDSDAFISFPSFDPDGFLTFSEDFATAQELKTVESPVITSAIKFIQGFLSDDKNKKYSNVYIVDGKIYGANGSSKIGAFISPSFEGVNLVLRRALLSAISTFIDKSATEEVLIKQTEKIIIFSTSKGLDNFAFRKSVIDIPKLPISTQMPKAEGFIVDREALLKKLNRLFLTHNQRNPEFGLKISVKGTDIVMETIADRKSIEKITCERISGNGALDFTIDCIKLKDVLSLFSAERVDVYQEKGKCTLYSDAQIVIKEGEPPITSPFISIGLVTLAKVV
jgi:DNA polymerase III sliding clamp (beta) subunit (PCNA family)